MQFVRNILDMLIFACSTMVFYLLGYRLPWSKTTTGNFQKESEKTIPGPVSLPFLGTSWFFIFGGWKFSELHLFARHLYCKYGGVVKEEALFNIPIINVFEREDIEKVLKCQSKFPVRPPIEALAHYRRSRPDRYVSVGLVNEQDFLREEKNYKWLEALSVNPQLLRNNLNPAHLCCRHFKKIYFIEKKSQQRTLLCESVISIKFVKLE